MLTGSSTCLLDSHNVPRLNHATNAISIEADILSSLDLFRHRRVLHFHKKTGKSYKTVGSSWVNADSQEDSYVRTFLAI